MKEATDAEMPTEKPVEQDDSKYHVHRDTMIKFLELRQEYKSTVFSIPLAVLTLTSILSVMYYRTSPWRSFPIEKALIDNIVQPDGNGVVTTDTPIAFGDIGSAGDVFDWMQNTLIPMVASETDYNGNDIDYAVGDDWYTTDKRSAFIERRMGGSCGGGGSEQCRSGRVLGYNRLFYGVHVTQTRFNKTRCVAKGLTEYINYCYSAESAADDDGENGNKWRQKGNKWPSEIDTYPGWTAGSTEPIFSQMSSGGSESSSESGSSSDDGSGGGDGGGDDASSGESGSSGSSDDASGSGDGGGDDASSGESGSSDDAAVSEETDCSNGVDDDSDDDIDCDDSDCDSDAACATPAATPSRRLKEGGPPILSYNMKSQFGDSLLVDKYGGFWLLEMFTADDLKTFVDVYKDALWIDLTTKQVTFTIVTINNEFDVLAQTKMFVTFERGGLVDLDYSVTSTALKPYQKYTRAGSHANDNSELEHWERMQDFSLVLIAFGAAADLLLTGLGPWHAVDVTILVCALFGNHEWHQITLRTENVIQTIRSVNVTTMTPDDMAPMFTKFEGIMEGPVSEMRFFAFVMTVVLLMYTLKCFRFHPDFSILLNTIIKLFIQGFPFLFLFGLIFMIFVVGSIIIFGHQVWRPRARDGDVGDEGGQGKGVKGCYTGPGGRLAEGRFGLLQHSLLSFPPVAFRRLRTTGIRSTHRRRSFACSLVIGTWTRSPASTRKSRTRFSSCSPLSRISCS